MIVFQLRYVDLSWLSFYGYLSVDEMTLSLFTFRAGSLISRCCDNFGFPFRNILFVISIFLTKDSLANSCTTAGKFSGQVC